MARAPADSPPLRLVYLGTPGFALPSLRALASSRHDVVGVVTQPDRPRGRGRKLQPGPVRALAAELGLPVRQPAKVAEPDTVEWLRGLRHDLGVVVAFGQFVPKSVRELPTHGMINAHASLLPRWRGAAPIHWAILEGDRTTGVSVMRLVKELDAGDVCLTRETEIGPGETAGELGERLAELAAEALLVAVDDIAAGRAVFRAQDPAGVTEAPKIAREFARLDWDEPAECVLRRIRASSPRPGADLVLAGDGKKLRIVEARRAADPGVPERCGAVRATDGRLCVAARDAWVEIARLQAPGRGPVSAAEFLRGVEISPDERVAE
ncbi:MAG: methionyl-tRNA formyltransferase [Myxococcota bacterium]